MPVSSGHWEFEELGCGHYGCVIPTRRDDIVFKLTSDPTEGEFIQLAQPLGWPEGIVRYDALIALTFTYRRRPVFALWREAAYNVGKLHPGYNYDRRDWKIRKRFEFIANLDRFKDHAARFRDQLKRSKDPSALWAETKELEQWAWDNVGVDDAEGKLPSVGYGRRSYRYIEAHRSAQRAALSLRACAIIATSMEHTELSDSVGAAFSFYLENGFLLADVHAGNVGQAKREDDWMPWVITDPGHVVVLG